MAFDDGQSRLRGFPRNVPLKFFTGYSRRCPLNKFCFKQTRTPLCKVISHFAMDLNGSPCDCHNVALVAIPCASLITSFQPSLPLQDGVM